MDDKADGKDYLAIGQGDVREWNGRGVWVPHGQSVEAVMRIAEMLESEFEVVPYTSRSMAIAAIKILQSTPAAVPAT